MSLNIPTTRKEVSGRIKSDVQSQLSDSNPYLKNSFLQALIYGLSGRVFDLYKTEKRLLDLLFWDTTEGEYLERAASIFGITRNSASKSTGYITIGGTATTSIPLGTKFQNSSGLEVESLEISTIAANTLSISSLTQSAGVATAVSTTAHNLAAGISVTISGANESDYNDTFEVTNILSTTSFQFSVASGASSPATGTIVAAYTTASIQVQSVDQGSDNNIDAGDTLTITTPIAGVDNDGYAQFEGLQGAADEESDSDLRDRFLFRVRNPVALFNEAAIELKAKEVTGVTRVFIFNVDDDVKQISCTSLTQLGNGVAVYEATANHNLVDGQRITIDSATETEYNVDNVPIIVLSATKFAYAISGNPASPSVSTPNATTSTVQEGDVKVFFTRDNDSSIIPSATEVSTVKDKLLTIKPAHMSDESIVVQAPTPKTVNFTFSSITEDTSSMRDAIEDNLEAFFKSGTFVGRDLLENEYDSAIFNTVDPTNSEKLESFTLTSPSGDVSVAEEEIPILGTISYV